MYERKPGPASQRGRYGKLFEQILKKGQDVPNIIYDGIADPATFDKEGKPLADKRICIRNNKNQSIVNLDAGRGLKNVSFETTPFDCQLTPLKATAVNAR